MGAELVLRLARALQVPLRERNALLVAAGLAPAFTTHELQGAALRPISLVIERVLRGHDPYPAWVFARGLRPVAANVAGERLFPGLTAMSAEAIVDLWFGAGPFREMVENWAEVVTAGVDALRRESAQALDPAISALLARAERHLAGHDVIAPSSTFPVVCPRFRIGDRTVRTVSAVMRFDTAVDVTASELRIELMFPADEESEGFFRSG